MSNLKIQEASPPLLSPSDDNGINIFVQFNLFQSSKQVQMLATRKAHLINSLVLTVWWHGHIALSRKDQYCTFTYLNNGS